jgi:hypothetical protein
MDLQRESAKGIDVLPKALVRQRPNLNQDFPRCPLWFIRVAL